MKRLTIALLALVFATGAAPHRIPTSADELGAALKTLKAKHINRATADWPAIEAQAWRSLPRTANPQDAYPAIRAVIKALREKHSFLMTREEWKADMSREQQGATRPDAMPPPEFRMLDARTGYVHVLAFLGDDRTVKTYQTNFRAQMERLRKAGACRYVVDLRGNFGGNMWPMLTGLAPLLGAPPFGFFEPGADSGAVWTMKGGDVAGIDTDISKVPAYNAHAEAAPVAVLVDKKTSSSGEFTAMAFAGRAGARLFGQPTAGYVTANDVFPLPDGAMMAVTVSGAQDRLHRPYRERIVPEVETPAGPATEAAARVWLDARPCTDR